MVITVPRNGAVLRGIKELNGNQMYDKTFEMPANTGEREIESPDRVSPQLSSYHVFAMLVSIQIGSGMFASPSLVVFMFHLRCRLFCGIWNYAILALGVILVLYVLNIHGTKTSARASGMFTAFKLTIVAMLALEGFVVAFSQMLSQHGCEKADWYSKSWLECRKTASGTSRIDWTQMAWWPMIGHFYPRSWLGYSSYIAGDLIDVRRNLPKTIHFSIAAVMLSLGIVDISYYILLPWLDIGSGKTVAVVGVLANFGSMDPLPLQSLQYWFPSPVLEL
ncbi:hypothetical protein MMC31_007555 [Peltigera leucophlebia]|nr:hypothetical protein [Peltigera leucophlebia]